MADGWWLPGATMVTLVISAPMHHLVANHGVVTDWRHDRPTLAPPITLIRPLSLLMRQRIISTPHITHRPNHQPTQYLKPPSASFPHSQQPSGIMLVILTIATVHHLAKTGAKGKNILVAIV